MRAAADELRARLRRSSIAGSVLPKALAWSVGALILAPESWIAAAAAVGGTAAELLSERAFSRPSRSSRALLHHYATLGGRPSVMDHGASDTGG